MLIYFYHLHLPTILFFFFFNDTATTEIYTLSLHDALPISRVARRTRPAPRRRSDPKECLPWSRTRAPPAHVAGDRKSTRLNSSHGYISYAVFCLKKKKTKYKNCTCEDVLLQRLCCYGHLVT